MKSYILGELLKLQRQIEIDTMELTPLKTYLANMKMIETLTYWNSVEEAPELTLKEKDYVDYLIQSHITNIIE